VVAAIEDPYPLVSGRGFRTLRDRGVEVATGVEREQAIRLNQPYLMAIREGRPFVILKAATSVDGRVAAAAGTRTQLTSIVAARHAHHQRAQVDAIAIGSGTLLVDDPLLTTRHVYRERPLARVIFDRRLRTPSTARVFSTLAAGPVIILTAPEAKQLHSEQADALERAGATIEAVGPTMTAAFATLVQRGIQSVVLEGGIGVHQAAWDEALVDYVQLYVAPVTLGPDAPPVAAGPMSAIPSLVDQKVQMLGPDVLIEGYVHRPH
jgi:diaminohydroxyphosphoribosylaminopyrimidine deaminase/5-amino-6-(5-phosphoribosylamino)uracil reductase